MKNLILIQLILFFGILDCAYIKSNEQDSKGALLFSLIQNSQNNFKSDNLKSTVYLEKVDASTFKGNCFDSFYGTITASNYYDLNYKLIPSIARAYSSSSTCSQLGFAGLGADQSLNSGVKYKVYYCDASYSPCSDNAITGKINGVSIIGKGTDGSTKGSAFDCTSRPNWFCQ